MRLFRSEPLRPSRPLREARPTAAEIKGALELLQRAVTKKFGTAVESDAGGCTLEIAHDRVELTGLRHRLVALDVDEVVGELA